MGLVRVAALDVAFVSGWWYRRGRYSGAIRKGTKTIEGNRDTVTHLLLAPRIAPYYSTESFRIFRAMICHWILIVELVNTEHAHTITRARIVKQALA